MEIVSFLINLAGATMLLLFAVRMVQTGIKRNFGASFKRLLTTRTNLVRHLASGIGLAVILQSSAAVAMLVAGFAGAGMLSFTTGLAMVLGADFGSALLIQLLSFRMDWLVPVLLAIGGGLFVKSGRPSFRQFGRIILGIAFILISLQFLRTAMEPIRDSSFMPWLMGYLEQDIVAAFIVGAALAFVMHSSVAVILMCVTLVSIDTVPVTVGMSLVLGANLGSALIPVWLSRGMVAKSRQIIMANLLVRGSGAVIAAMFVHHMDLPFWVLNLSGAQSLIIVHVAFNGLLLLVAPFGIFVQKPIRLLISDKADSSSENHPEFRSLLEGVPSASPKIALANLKREVLRMLQMVETMCEPVMDIYQSGDAEKAKVVSAQDRHVNRALDGVRLYISKLSGKAMGDSDRQLAHEMTEYAIALESAGDVVVKQMIPRALQKAKDGIMFSADGQNELQNMHERVLENMRLAANVLVSDDIESARLLIEQKSEISQMERASRKKHLARLGRGAVVSFDSSNIHLETLRAYKDLSSLVAAVAYPILYREGQLLETRLINDLT